ncbi:MAG: methyltransferase domain-containing protein [Pseudomonadota bacterium]
MASAPREIFDFQRLRRNRDRAARDGFGEGADFLRRAAAESLIDRLRDTPRRFERALMLGEGVGPIKEAFQQVLPERALSVFEPAPILAKTAEVVSIAEEVLPVAEARADLAVSAFLLHHLNDPVGHLIQLRRALVPDGLVLLAALGGQTLAELRTAFAEAEVELLGGLSPRVAPMAEIRDLGSLLQRAGLVMPVADTERLTVTYETPLHLMRDLRAMGETSILLDRPKSCLRRDVLARMSEIYHAHFTATGGRIRASFELIYLTGWSPGPDQPQPLRPGTATNRMADALGTFEVPMGEKTIDQG